MLLFRLPIHETFSFSGHGGVSTVLPPPLTTCSGEVSKALRKTSSWCTSNLVCLRNKLFWIDSESCLFSMPYVTNSSRFAWYFSRCKCWKSRILGTFLVLGKLGRLVTLAFRDDKSFSLCFVSSSVTWGENNVEMSSFLLLNFGGNQYNFENVYIILTTHE